MLVSKQVSSHSLWKVSLWKPAFFHQAGTAYTLSTNGKNYQQIGTNTASCGHQTTLTPDNLPLVSASFHTASPVNSCILRALPEFLRLLDVSFRSTAVLFSVRRFERGQRDFSKNIERQISALSNCSTAPTCRRPNRIAQTVSASASIFVLKAIHLLSVTQRAARASEHLG